jgi:transposase
MDHIGIDLGSVNSQVCVRSSAGEILLETVVKTHHLRSFFSGRAPSRVILETCAETFAVARWAQAAGHDVRVVPATLARTLGVGARGIKTDRRDAQALSAASCRVELGSVHIRSRRSQELQSMVRMRRSLIGARTKLINSVRGWLRTELIRVRSGVPKTFPDRVEAALLKTPLGVAAFVERQLAVIRALNEQIREADAEVERLAKADPVCVLLMTVPGVGFLTALQFRATLDVVERFESAHAVQSYLGLTPGEHSSSFTKRRTSITKAGPRDLRHVLIQACWVMWMTRPHDPLVQWGKQLAAKKHRSVAIVAMARKLSGILYALWRDGRTYRPAEAASIPSAA